MATLVFDIETSALPPESFDEVQQEYLFRDCERIRGSDRPRETAHGDRQHDESLAVHFAHRLHRDAQCRERARPGALSRRRISRKRRAEAGPVEFVPCVDEAEMLAQFWDVAKHYDKIVTFNGRGFDVPFLYLRSAQLNVPISRKDWLGYRFATEPHCDLAEQLTFYSVSGRDGAARKFNLDFYCKAFGIESPKSHGVTGMDVKRLMDEGRYREIAEYCLRDVVATVKLYQIWKERLAGIK